MHYSNLEKLAYEDEVKMGILGALLGTAIGGGVAGLRNWKKFKAVFEPMMEFAKKDVKTSALTGLTAGIGGGAVVGNIFKKPEMEE